VEPGLRLPGRSGGHSSVWRESHESRLRPQNSWSTWWRDRAQGPFPRWCASAQDPNRGFLSIALFSNPKKRCRPPCWIAIRSPSRLLAMPHLRGAPRWQQARPHCSLSGAGSANRTGEAFLSPVQAGRAGLDIKRHYMELRPPLAGRVYMTFYRHPAPYAGAAETLRIKVDFTSRLAARPR